MKSEQFLDVFIRALNILNIKFNIFGIDVTLYQFIIYEILGVLILGRIIYLLRR